MGLIHCNIIYTGFALKLLFVQSDCHNAEKLGKLKKKAFQININ